MIKDKVPTGPADFTRALPQHISLKIFSHLDPRTLAQASLVSQTQVNVLFRGFLLTKTDVTCGNCCCFIQAEYVTSAVVYVRTSS